MTDHARSANLARLLRPRHIAVFGGRFAAAVIRETERIGFSGDIWPVNPTRGELGGRPCFADVDALPEAPDASFIAVPREATIDIVAALAARGAGGAVCYAAGFAEAGDEGRALQQALIATAGDLAVVGPNCYGLLNYLDGATLWPDLHGGVGTEHGVAIVTQSGNMGISLTMQQRSLPLAYLISVGNQAVLSISDYIEALIADPRVKAIGIHMESVGDVQRFSQAAVAAYEARVPLVVLKVGRSVLGARAALSHTSALVGNDALYQALFERMRIARVHTLAELLETLKLLCVSGPLPGRQVASISCSGGEAALVADAAEKLGMDMPAFDAHQESRLREVLGPQVHVANPLDYHTFIWGDPHRQRACFSAVLEGRQDLTIKVLDYPSPAFTDSADWDNTLDAFIDAASAAVTPAVVVSTLPENLPARVREKLLAKGITPLQGLEEGMHAVKAAMDFGAWYREARPPLAVTVNKLEGGPLVTLNDWVARAELRNRGVVLPGYRSARANTLLEAGEDIGYPVVLKAADVEHKSDVGGVALDIRDGEALLRAAESMGPTRDNFYVESMIGGGIVELLVGVAHDEQFGQTLTIGAGGMLVELFRERCTLLYPLTREAVAEALDRLAIARLLDGYRGRPGGDRRAAIDAIMAIASPTSRIQELEVNPLIVLAQGRGAVAVDVLIRARGETGWD